MDQHDKTNIRPPIVTVMGHVDHGKTTLLDTVRKTNVATREHGGITQHIGAYQVSFKGKLITFIDTPGHAAFEKMRSRGAEVADIVILVVAANEGVKPQTVEAIEHINKADRPLVVAITKVDLAPDNIEKVKKELHAKNVLVESLGGKIPVCAVNAKTGQGVDDLLEVVQLVWQISPQPSFSTNDRPEAVVIESFMDKKRGPIVNVIVKKGLLKVGQKLTSDRDMITIRALIDDNGLNLEKAEPSKPVEILGFKKILEVGSIIGSLETSSPPVEKSKTIADIIAKSQSIRDKFKVIIKSDVAGTLEAILANLPPKILVVSSGTGDVEQADVSLAKVIGAPILAFNVKVVSSVKSQADREGIIIKNYNVIYRLVSDLEDIASSFEEAKHELKITGKAKIIAIFDLDGKKIAGVKVTNGKIKIGDNVVLKSSDSASGHQAKIISLRRFKKDVELVSAGQDCGTGFDQDLDFNVGDIIESLG